MHLDRRQFLTAAGLTALSGLAGCATTTTGATVAPAETQSSPQLAAYDAMYAAQPDEQFPLPAIPHKRIKPQFLRQWVDNPTGERPGTLVVDVGNHFLYLTQPGGKAMRYGVGLGREGFAWKGRARVGWKQAWPKWTPPDEMIGRQPELAQYSADNGGMPPGLQNPLGARALYIFQGNKDTLYRIHGSPEYWTIGTAVSSGCVRMMNQDVIDLYGRVPTDSPIVVL